MEKVSIIGADIAKSVFQAHGADASGGVVFRKKINRTKLLEFFASLTPCTVAMEACGGAHRWARAITKLGHEVKLIALKYVKPFVKRQKNDMADAEAICEAASRPTMRFVAVKSDTVQASARVFRTRDILVRQRTQITNAVRGHLAEYGIVVPQGAGHFKKLVAYLEDPASPLPDEVRSILSLLVQTATGLGEKIGWLDKEIARRAKEDQAARRLMTIPGAGPITQLRSRPWRRRRQASGRGETSPPGSGSLPCRNRAEASRGLAQLQRWGERTLRRLLIIGAAAAIHQAVRRGVPPTSWLGRMLARKPRMLVIVALANKMGPDRLGASGQR